MMSRKSEAGNMKHVSLTEAIFQGQQLVKAQVLFYPCFAVKYIYQGKYESYKYVHLATILHVSLI